MHVLTCYPLLLHSSRIVHLTSKWILLLNCLALPTHWWVLRRPCVIHRLFWLLVRRVRVLTLLFLELGMLSLSLIICLILVCGRRKISGLIWLISSITLEALILQLEASDLLITHLQWLLLSCVGWGPTASTTIWGSLGCMRPFL